MHSSNKKLKVLVVGAGMYVSGRGTKGFGTILPALNELHKNGVVADPCVSATTIKSIIDIKKKTETLKKLTNSQISINGYPKKKNDNQSFKKAFEEYEPDCAIIVVPDHLHFDITSYLLEKSIHCLVVKPLTPTVKEAKKLIELTISNTTYGAVEFHKRQDLANIKLKNIIEDGSIGKPLYFHVEYSQRRDIPIKLFKNWAAKSNIFQYLGVHYVDIIYFATRAKPKRVIATGQKKLLIKQDIDTYDSIQTIIEWESEIYGKFISSHLTNWIDPKSTSAMSDQKIKVIGTKGRYESDQKNRGIQIVTEEGIEDFNPYFSQSYELGKSGVKIFSGYGIDSINQFCYDIISIKEKSKSIESFEGIRPTFRDALISTAVIEANNYSLGNNSIWTSIST